MVRRTNDVLKAARELVDDVTHRVPAPRAAATRTAARARPLPARRQQALAHRLHHLRSYEAARLSKEK